MDPAHPDGFTRLKLKSEPVDPAHRDGSSNVSASAEGSFPEHCGGPQSQSIGIGTSGMLDEEGSGFLSISDRALLRRFGQLDTPRKDLRRVEESSLEVTTNVSRVDGHPLKLSMNLLDRALLRRFPDAISASSFLPYTKQPEDSVPSSAASNVPSHGEVAKNSTKKRKRFIGKGNTKKAEFVSGTD